MERLTPDQLSQIYVKGSADKLVPLSTFATLKTTTEPRSLNKFQQLNAVRIQGVIPPPVPLDQALTFLENEAKRFCPKDSQLIMRENLGSCALKAASSSERFCCRQS